MRPILIAAIPLLLLPFAGCTSGEGSPTATDTFAPTPVVDEDTGAIHGLVMDESLQPLSGALVGILERDAQATTDQAGSFTFNGREEGDYTVSVQALGYESNARRVTVRAGEVTEVRFELKQLAIDEPYHEMIPKRGFWTAAVATLVAVPNTGAANMEHRVNFDVAKDWNTTMVELTWKYSNPGQATTPGAWWNNQAVPKGSSSSSSVGEVFGKVAPVTAQFHPGEVYRGDGYRGTRSAFPEGPYNHNMYVFPLGLLTDETQPAFNTALSGSRSRGVGTSFQQPFSVYISLFYHAGPPTDYTAIPDV